MFAALLVLVVIVLSFLCGVLLVRVNRLQVAVKSLSDVVRSLQSSPNAGANG